MQDRSTDKRTMTLTTSLLFFMFFLAATVLANMDVETNQSGQQKEGKIYTVPAQYIAYTRIVA